MSLILDHKDDRILTDRKIKIKIQTNKIVDNFSIKDILSLISLIEYI